MSSSCWRPMLDRLVATLLEHETIAGSVVYQIAHVSEPRRSSPPAGLAPARVPMSPSAGEPDGR